MKSLSTVAVKTRNSATMNRSRRLRLSLSCNVEEERKILTFEEGRRKGCTGAGKGGRGWSAAIGEWQWRSEGKGKKKSSFHSLSEWERRKGERRGRRRRRRGGRMRLAC
ncbi:unnamed protein product [Victoria cruziana]